MDASSRKQALASAGIDQIDAIMPAHDHGMKVEPTIETIGEGTFRVEGMRFHMQGRRGRTGCGS